MTLAMTYSKTLRRMMPGSSQLSGSPSSLATAFLRSHEWRMCRSCDNSTHVVLSGLLIMEYFIKSVYKKNYTKADKKFMEHWRAQQKRNSSKKLVNHQWGSPDVPLYSWGWTFKNIEKITKTLGKLLGARHHSQGRIKAQVGTGVHHKA